MLAVAVCMSGFAQRQKATLSKELKNQSVTVQKPSDLRISDGSQAQASQFSPVQTIVNNSAKDDSEWGSWGIAIESYYDLQSNSALGNRIATWPDGTASFVATFEPEEDASFPNRGTGYNFFDGTDLVYDYADMERQESVKSGWPSIVACGEGELLTSHATGVNLYYRPTKGEGDWQLIYNWGSAYGSPTWARVAVSGPNNEYVHVVMARQINVGTNANPIYDNHVYYVRIVRDGNNWIVPEELNDFPGLDNTDDGDYRNQLSADDYVMAANGNNVAVMFSAYTTEVFYMISHDNGETWERQVIAPYPILGTDGNPVHAIDFNDYPDGMTDTIITSDGSHCIAIDNNGVVHACFGLFRWRVTDSDHYTYYPLYSYGIVYWNSEYRNEQGGNEIPLFGQFSNDATHTEWQSNGVGYTLVDDRIIELANADNGEHLWFFGVIDENGNDQLDFQNPTDLAWHYRSYGWATLPGIAVDENGSLAIIYNACSETRTNAVYGADLHLRSAYITCRDSQGEWYDDATVNFGDQTIFALALAEMYATTAAPRAYDGDFFFSFSADLYQGLYLDINEDNYPNSNMATLTTNDIYAIKFTPSGFLPTWDGIEDHNDVNPVAEVSVYPNPVKDFMTVKVNASSNSDATLSVYNITGQKVAEKTTTFNVGPFNEVSFDTNELSSGVYFVTVKANNFEKTMKFVVK